MCIEVLETVDMQKLDPRNTLTLMLCTSW